MKHCIYCNKPITGRGELYCSRDCSNKHRREQERDKRHTYTVWSCGGGVQSTAIAALIYTGKIPKPDYSIMVDTGYEKSFVMDYVRGTIIKKLSEIGVNLEIVKTTDYYPEQSIIDANGYCVIPVFKMKGDNRQRLKTCCNDKWKVNVIRKWLTDKGVEQYVSLIGISTDESHRQRQAHKKYYQNRYPLIEMGMDRDDCVNYIKSIGWDEPPRSSCYICGQQDDGEWWRMAMLHKDDFAKAVQVEKELQAIDENIYLNRKCKPLDELFRL